MYPIKKFKKIFDTSQNLKKMEISIKKNEKLKTNSGHLLRPSAEHISWQRKFTIFTVFQEFGFQSGIKGKIKRKFRII